MIAKKTYLKGKSVFIVSLFTIGITFLTVYLTGENYNRTVTSNLYLSLSIIGTTLFLFMTYGLYNGIQLRDNYPKFKNLKTGDILSSAGEFPDWDMPSVESDDFISGLIISILLWIVMTIIFFFLLIILEAVFWVSIFIILAMLYWVFFRALKFVFSKNKETKGKLSVSILYSFSYSVLYLSWIFGIVYLTEVLSK